MDLTSLHHFFFEITHMLASCCCMFAVFQISGSIALTERGDCDFTTKAKIAQSGGAAALVVINDKEGS